MEAHRTELCLPRRSLQQKANAEPHKVAVGDILSNTHERTAFGLRICKNSHPDIRKIKRDTGEAEIHGNKFWRSSLLLMDYFQEFPLKRASRVLEIGCGWGLAGLFLAKYQQARVTSLDADASVFPYLDYHANLNGVQSTTWCQRFEKISVANLEDFDLVIGADICFWDTLSPILFNLNRRAQRAGCRVVLSDPGRPPFREMAQRSVEKLNADYQNWHVGHPHNASGLIIDL